MTRKGSIGVKLHSGVNDDPEINQLDAEYDPELGQSDPIIRQVCRKLTKLWVTVDPELSMTLTDPFPGHTDPWGLLYKTFTGIKILKLW